jgi:uncharacterized protein YcnI
MIRKLLVAGCCSAGIILGAATPAFAHVTVDPASAPQGAEITLGFRVPNEMSNAGTVKIQIFFPSSNPILGVDPQSVPGWQDKIYTKTLNPPVNTDDGPVTSYVSEVDWTGGPIQPGHFHEFYVLAQRLPTGVNQVVFKALQTYSNGSVVRWIDPITPQNSDPANPTPILTLTPAGVTTGAPVANPASSSDVSTARTIAIIGLVVGVLGLAAAVWAIITIRRTGHRPADTA